MGPYSRWLSARIDRADAAAQSGAPLPRLLLVLWGWLIPPGGARR